MIRQKLTMYFEANYVNMQHICNILGFTTIILFIYVISIKMVSMLLQNYMKVPPF
jgi:hypothetical protein